MNAATSESSAAPLEGGFYAGRICIDGKAFALIVAPKAEGERKPGVWNKSDAMVESASSWNDGLSNTVAMATAGSELATWAQGLRIGGFSDWYIPSLDELEVCYRYLKPTTDENSLWSRSGINLSAIPPTYPYTTDSPKQTDNDLFRTGGAEAFVESYYWSSTQLASSSLNAWYQSFGNGYQDYWFKDSNIRARAVRRLTI